jgi:hypothetical protein
MTLALANGALVAVPGAGHNVHEERPDEVVPTLLAFLAAGLPRPPGDLAAVTPRRVDKSTE